MTRATNAGGSLSSASYVSSLRRAPADPRQIFLLRAKGLGVQNIALQTGASMEDVRKILASDAAELVLPTPRRAAPPKRATTGGTPPRVLTERDHFILEMVEKGDVSQYAAAALLNCTAKSIRRYLDRRADDRSAA